MAERIKGKSAGNSLVFHDGTNMIVINKGKPFDVDAEHRQRLIDGGVLAGEAKMAPADVQPVKADGAGQSEPGADAAP